MEPIFSNFKPGDYIVGKYSEMGTEIKAGKLEGDSDQIEEMQQMVEDHAKRTGGREIIVKTTTAKKVAKKSKKVPAIQQVDEEAFEPFFEASEKPIIQNNTRTSKKYIYLYNKLGKIKLSIESLIECEQAYCVVFHTEDDLIFVPNAGETLTMVTPSGDEVSVYYANTLFTWTDNVKQLLILFKVNE